MSVGSERTSTIGLAAVPIRLPPLRERRPDIPDLALGYLRRISADRDWQLHPELKTRLIQGEESWPGNVRQLERIVQRARDLALSQDPESRVLRPDHLDWRSIDGSRPGAPPPAKEAAAERSRDGRALADQWRALRDRRVALDEEEVATIRAALIEHEGVVSKAARALGVARTTLSNRVAALGLEGTGRK